VKERQKQLQSYKKLMKRHAKQGNKNELAQVKKEYIRLLLNPLKREFYQREEEYLKEMQRTIRENENKFIVLKLDLCYDLHDGLKEFDAYENTVNQLKKKYEAALHTKKQRETAVEKTKKEQEEQLKGMMESYPYLELEDKKKAYPEWIKQTGEMANPSRKVIAYEIENKEIEYRLTQLYTPWVDVKILGSM